jgi:hypothetical protein
MFSRNDLFNSNLNVLNVGLEQFHHTMIDQDITSINVEWRPSAGGDLKLIKIIEKLKNDSRVIEANKQALSRLDSAMPFWIDVMSAREAIGLKKYSILHAGPPIKWLEMCVPMQGAIIAAIKYEALASTDEEAIEIAKNKITFEPCHHYNCVAPMTGIISASMPLICVKNTTHGNLAYSTFNEGAGDVARFGAFNEKTIQRLKWIETSLAPIMKKIVLKEPVNLKILISQALNMGDELHMRNNSSTSIFIKSIISNLVDITSGDELKSVIHFLTNNNDQFFLNFGMAAMKVSSDAGHGIQYSTMVTAITRNGVNIGVRVSGLKNQWFMAPSADVKGLYFAGFSEVDANPDIGDSAIMETGGVGGFAMAAAPAIVKFLGAGSFKEALNYTQEMYEICLGESGMYLIPNLDFRGSPLGIDIIKVVESRLLPVINTAIASKKAGGGMIGAGLARAPMQMFEDALNKIYNQMEE